MSFLAVFLSNYRLLLYILQYLAIEAILRPPKIMIRYKKMKFTIFGKIRVKDVFDLTLRSTCVILFLLCIHFEYF